MKALSRIGLGTAQFGSNYGISNTQGRPDEPEVAGIVAHAVQFGIGYLDTAIGYGDTERLLGRHLPPGHELRIVTKTPSVLEESVEARHRATLLDQIEASLERLRIDRVYGLLVHRAPDLLKPGWQHLVE